MKKAAIFITLVLLVAPLAANAAVRAKARAKAPVKYNYNCSDFATHKQAQDFFIKNGGPKKDPYRLDGDKDGLACEKLP